MKICIASENTCYYNAHSPFYKNRIDWSRHKNQNKIIYFQETGFAFQQNRMYYTRGRYFLTY